jgi:threonyl-tRNA synthetase
LQLNNGWYELKSNFIGKDQYGPNIFPVMTNDYGFRKGPNSPNGGKHEFIFLGDSFTYGINGAWNETFVGIFEAQSGKMVLNAGVSSYSPSAYLFQYKKALKNGALSAKHTVIVALDISDVQDEAAFYGPKIDVQIWSAIGREFTLATNQVDFNSGNKFKLTYTTKDNGTDVPLIIHRAPLGTHERFIGFLLEHYAGKFPAWLAPLQVKILPISDKFMDYANTILKTLKNADIRAEIDDRNEKIGKKIRDTEMAKVPYMLVIGEKEMAESTVAVRRQGKGDLGVKGLDAFTADLAAEIMERRGE